MESTKTLQHWKNEDTGKYYIINESGSQYNCNSCGIKESKFLPNITGNASFGDRLQLTLNNKKIRFLPVLQDEEVEKFRDKFKKRINDKSNDSYYNKNFGVGSHKIRHKVSEVQLEKLSPRGIIIQGDSNYEDNRKVRRSQSPNREDSINLRVQKEKIENLLMTQLKGKMKGISKKKNSTTNIGYSEDKQKYYNFHQIKEKPPLPNQMKKSGSNQLYKLENQSSSSSLKKSRQSLKNLYSTTDISPLKQFQMTSFQETVPLNLNKVRKIINNDQSYQDLKSTESRTKSYHKHTGSMSRRNDHELLLDSEDQIQIKTQARLINSRIMHKRNYTQLKGVRSNNSLIQDLLKKDFDNAHGTVIQNNNQLKKNSLKNSNGVKQEVEEYNPFIFQGEFNMDNGSLRKNDMKILTTSNPFALNEFYKQEQLFMKRRENKKQLLTRLIKLHQHKTKQ